MKRFAILVVAIFALVLFEGQADAQCGYGGGFRGGSGISIGIGTGGFNRGFGGFGVGPGFNRGFGGYGGVGGFGPSFSYRPVYRAVPVYRAPTVYGGFGGFGGGYSRGFGVRGCGW